MTPPAKITARFLLEREVAGESRRVLMALYPRRLWPEHWADEDQQLPEEGEDDER